jgi:hypothetical protein
MVASTIVAVPIPTMVAHAIHTTVVSAEEVAEYQAGYTYNELYGEKKDYS